MAEEVKKKEHSEEKSLEKMTVKDLRVIALEFPRSASVYTMKKEELIAFIKEAKGIKDEDSKKKKVKDIERIKLTKQEVKAKIKLLKEERIASQEKKDKKREVFLRRKISHLKKQTRRMAL
jgi:hypothetical protein